MIKVFMMTLPTSSISDKKTISPVNPEHGAAEDSWLLDRARMMVYRVLSLALSDPQREEWPGISDPNFQELAEAAVGVIREDPLSCPDTLAPGEISPEALSMTLASPSFQLPREKLVEEYDRVFGLLVSGDCPPCETEYCPQTFSVYRSHQMADIAGYYRAFGLEPSRHSPRRHDHIVLELEFMAWLIAKELYAAEQGDQDNADLCREAQVSFFRDHGAWWIPAFALALRRKADGIAGIEDLKSPPKSYLGAVGSFLAAFVPAERGILGIPPATAWPSNTESEWEDCETCPSGADPTSE